MPILNEPNDDVPLTQGDILKGIPLFATKANWGDEDEPYYRVKAPLCMVISRPCVVSHKPQVVVASIEKVVVSIPKETDTLEKVRDFLENLRDGDANPDRFYLGQEIPNFPEEGRFFARLDSLHTVRLPGSDLSAVASSHRIAVLADDFRRDLHCRIFSAFARLGFDDCGWYSDQDLEWVIASAKKDLSSRSADLSDKQTEIARNIAGGESVRNAKLNKDVEKLEETKLAIQKELDRLEIEKGRRSDRKGS